MESPTKLKQIIAHYGVRNQAKKLMEETAELVEALQDYVDDNDFENLKHIEEETADCYVLINQFYLVYTADSEEEERLIRQEQETLHDTKMTYAELLVQAACCLIVANAHFKSTGKDIEQVRKPIRRYLATLWLLETKLGLKESRIFSIFHQKIERQLMRIKNENSI